ncbi:MAG TPA: ferredoxin oxidoreductase, partial [Sulfurovum sp.]|nr:ferredoxin oxidoreductase [Sulfurovum sp.]
AKEAHRELAKLGVKSKVVKLRTIRPFPAEELIEATKSAKYIFVPEFNVNGWLNNEVLQALYGKSKAEVIGKPRVAGGMSMPVEIILKEVSNFVKIDVGV